MVDSVAGVVLAAGAGTRLAPLTSLRPKALCPVGTRPLVLHALDRLTTAGLGSDDPDAPPTSGSVAVNLHAGVDRLDAALPAGVHRSVEHPAALGTAGALGLLRPWIDGRDVLVTNADAWFPPGVDLAPFVAGWDHERVRLLCVDDPNRGDFGRRRYCGVALMPWSAVSALAAEPAGLYEVSWRTEAAAGRLDLVDHDGEFVDCGTVGDYLAANLLSSGGATVVDPAAFVHEGARLERCVVWDDSEVAAGEVLVDAIRAEHLTVMVR